MHTCSKQSLLIACNAQCVDYKVHVLVSSLRQRVYSIGLHVGFGNGLLDVVDMYCLTMCL